VKAYEDHHKAAPAAVFCEKQELRAKQIGTEEGLQGIEVIGESSARWTRLQTGLQSCPHLAPVFRVEEKVQEAGRMPCLRFGACA
jgi:hypothetical protein